MQFDGATIFWDLLQTATMALFAVSAFYVKGIAAEVKEIRKDVTTHTTEIAVLKATQGDK